MVDMLIVNYRYEKTKTMETSLTNWLRNPSNVHLYDSLSPGHYYPANCKSIKYVDSDEGMNAVITFEAYRLMKSDLVEGNDIWDEFNFELDVAQETNFTVNGTENIKLINPCSNVIIPKIRASSDFEVVKDNQTFIIPEGTSESSEFILNIGENDLTILGNGEIEFQFYKELL